MNTTRNLARVFAMALRGASQDLRGCTSAPDAESIAMRAAALESIEAVAEELEAFWTRPDPAGVPPT